MKKKIVNMINILADVITEKSVAALKNMNEKRIANETAQLFNTCSNALCIIRDNLFEVMHQNHYPSIEAISVPSNIRPVKFYKAENNTIVFVYSISKINTDTIPHAILSNISSNINNDIYYFTSYLINSYGLEYVANNNPILCAGIYVICVKDLGTDLQLQVVTNYKF